MKNLTGGTTLHVALVQLEMVNLTVDITGSESQFWSHLTQTILFYKVYDLHQFLYFLKDAFLYSMQNSKI